MPTCILPAAPGCGRAWRHLHLDGGAGRHDGIIHYTIGQRRGLGIAEAEPLYVAKVDAARQQVVVGPRRR